MIIPSNQFTCLAILSDHGRSAACATATQARECSRLTVSSLTSVVPEQWGQRGRTSRRYKVARARRRFQMTTLECSEYTLANIPDMRLRGCFAFPKLQHHHRTLGSMEKTLSTQMLSTGCESGHPWVARLFSGLDGSVNLRRLCRGLIDRLLRRHIGQFGASKAYPGRRSNKWAYRKHCLSRGWNSLQNGRSLMLYILLHVGMTRSKSFCIHNLYERTGYLKR